MVASHQKLTISANTFTQARTEQHRARQKHHQGHVHPVHSRVDGLCHRAESGHDGRADRAGRHLNADVVTLNSRLTCHVREDSTLHKLTLVYADQADLSAGRTSIMAPVGTALLGLRVGQTIEWPGPEGKPLTLKVTELGYQPEAAASHSAEIFD